LAIAAAVEAHPSTRAMSVDSLSPKLNDELAVACSRYTMAMLSTWITRAAKNGVRNALT
jgi:hypothetical protein